MFGQSLRQHFMVVGADMEVAVGGERFEIDVADKGTSEVFKLRLPSDGSVTAKVLDSNRDQQHLLLEVAHRGFGVNQKYLCGHDEFHWFVAALPEQPNAQTVPEAMEALKPKAVLREQRRKRVKRHRRAKRRTTAYVRQGEWFFLPCPESEVANRHIEENGLIRRGESKPHRVEFLCRVNGDVFARGAVSHPDHATIHLDQWHRVLRNTEVVPKDPVEERRRQLFAMKYVD
jgi:hypothetical protein